MTPFGVLFRYYFRRNHGPAVLGAAAALALLAFYALVRGLSDFTWLLGLASVVGACAILVAPFLWHERRENENMLVSVATKQALERAKVAAAMVLTAGLAVPFVLVSVATAGVPSLFPEMLAGFLYVIAFFGFFGAAGVAHSRAEKLAFLALSAAAIVVFSLAVQRDTPIMQLGAIFCAAITLTFAIAVTAGFVAFGARRVQRSFHEEMLNFSKLPATPWKNPPADENNADAPRSLDELLTRIRGASVKTDSVDSPPAKLKVMALYRRFTDLRFPFVIVWVTGAAAVHLAHPTLETLESGFVWLLVFALYGWRAMDIHDSVHFKMAPTSFRRGVFRRLLLPPLIIGVFLLASELGLPHTARKVGVDITGELNWHARIAEFDLGAAGRVTLSNPPERLVLPTPSYTWFAARDPVQRAAFEREFDKKQEKEREAIRRMSFESSAIEVDAEMDRAYVERQMKTLVWNECGVEGISFLKVLGRDDAWFFFILPSDQERIGKAMSRTTAFRVAVGIAIFLLLINVAFGAELPWRRPIFSSVMGKKPLFSVLSIAAVLLYIDFGMRHLVPDCPGLGLSLTPSGDIARSNWGYVYAFVNGHWTAFLAVTAALCAFLYWRALRGFLMTDITGASPRRWPWARKAGEGR